MYNIIQLNDKDFVGITIRLPKELGIKENKTSN